MALKNNRGAGDEAGPRLDVFCRTLARMKLSGAVLDAPADIFYYTGFTGSDAVLVVATAKRKTWLVTDARYSEEALKSAPGCEVVLWKDGFAAFTGSLVRKNRLRKIGFTPGSLRVKFFEEMRKAAQNSDGWADLQAGISQQRAIKSPAEVAALRAALRLAEAAFLAAKARWKIGMTELDARNDLEYEMRRLGASDPSFESIVAVGANASLPHAHAGSGKIAAGKMLLVDWGAKLKGYCSDSTRTLWPGEIPKPWLKRYEAVAAAGAAGLAAIRPGVLGKEVHAVAKAVLDKAGIGDKFTHGLGHGVGLAVHEEPRLAPAGRELAAGNIVTVEPGVYFPGSGGIRIEDMVLVTPDGGESLNTLPRGAEAAVF